jgi:membrane protease YdiL (CAAX protease family)
MVKKPIRPIKAVAIFLVATAYFFLLLFTLFPFLKSSFSVNPALYWFVTGYFLFIPLFAYALIVAGAEGNHGIRQILLSLNIRSFTKKEWAYSVIGLVIVFATSGLLFWVSSLMSARLGFGPLKTTPWFMEMEPFQGAERLLLLVWFPMFFFNVAGEELLWRGYIQTRLEGRYAWLLCSFLWLIFHLPFGLGIIVLALPAIVIIPYAFHKTHNTLVGIFIHGLYNGPIFMAIALGLIE